MSVLILGPAQFRDHTSPTIVRVHLQLFMLATVGLAAGTSPCVGLTQTNPDEPPPDPSVQRNSDRWQWWSCYQLIATDPPVYGMGSWRATVDVRAMRRVHNEEGELRLCLSTPLDAAQTDLYWAASVLLKD